MSARAQARAGARCGRGGRRPCGPGAARRADRRACDLRGPGRGGGLGRPGADRRRRRSGGPGRSVDAAVPVPRRSRPCCSPAPGCRPVWCGPCSSSTDPTCSNARSPLRPWPTRSTPCCVMRRCRSRPPPAVHGLPLLGDHRRRGRGRRHHAGHRDRRRPGRRPPEARVAAWWTSTSPTARPPPIWARGPTCSLAEARRRRRPDRRAPCCGAFAVKPAPRPRPARRGPRPGRPSTRSRPRGGLPAARRRLRAPTTG